MLTDEQIKVLVENYLKESLRESDGDPPVGDISIHEVLLDDPREDLVEGRHRKLANVAEFVLEAARESGLLPAHPDTPAADRVGLL